MRQRTRNSTKLKEEDEDDSLNDSVSESKESKESKTGKSLNNGDIERSLVEQYHHLQQLQASSEKLSKSVTAELERMHQEIHLMKSACASRLSLFDSSFADPTLKTAGAKRFVHRESKLNAMLRIKDFATVYNIFVAALPILLVSISIQEYVSSGNLVDVYEFQRYFYGIVHHVVPVWGLMQLVALIGYNFKTLIPLIPFPLLALICVCWHTGMALAAMVASAAILLCECARFTMKLHSFIREHLPDKDDAETSFARRNGDGLLKLSDVGFSHYVYFLFIPTLLYRTSYPRTATVRWRRVFVYFMEFSFIILYTYIIFSKYLFPVICVTPAENSTLRERALEIVLMMFNTMVASLVVLVFGFFGLLHSWMNMWAEALCFGDREFYRDWWNSHSFAEYYRKWNGVVYDWLHAYVYTDALLFLKSHQWNDKTARTVAAWFVIEVSAIIHEYILGVAFGFFYPILLVVYGGPGLIFTLFQPRKKDQNLFLWLMLLVGTGLLITLYSREFYLRKVHVKPFKFDSWQFWSQFVTPYSIRQLFGLGMPKF